MIWASAAGASIQPMRQPGHGPVLRQGLDVEDLLVVFRDIVEGGRACVDAEARVMEEAPVDLVGDDPQIMLAGEVAHGAQIIEARRPAGGIGGLC